MKNYAQLAESLIWAPEKLKQKVFKIERAHFNLDLLYFVRNLQWRYSVHTIDQLFWMNDFEFEIGSLKLTRDIYQQYLKANFTHSLEENEARLADPHLSYHSYFATVYKIERQRTLHHQITLANIAIETLAECHSGKLPMCESFVKMRPELENADYYAVNRRMLYDYFTRWSLQFPNDQFIK